MGRIVIFVLVLIGLAWMVAGAEAQSPTIVYLNQCNDADLECLNLTQAATRRETRQQANRACRGIKCPIIFSVDPKHRNQDVWEFGAWKRKGGIEFAAMPGCPNAERVLRRLVRAK